MPAISHINASITDHTMAVKFIGVCLVIAGGILAAAAILQSSDLSASNSAPQAAVTTTQQSASTTATLKVQTLAQPLTIAGVGVATATPLAEQPNTATTLQPATSPVSASNMTAATLQPAANSIQLTGNNLQNAAVVLQ